MDYNAIELIKTDLLKKLDSKFSYLNDFSKLENISDEFDKYLETYIIEGVFEHNFYFFDDIKINKNHKYIEKAGIYYNVGIYADIFNPNALILKILYLPDNGREIKPHNDYTVEIKKFGRYERIKLIYNIDLMEDKISHFISSVFDTAYAWFIGEKFKAVFENEKISIAKEIFSRIKSVIPNEEIWPKIWFGAITKEQGIYLLDHEVVNKALEKLKPGSSVLSISPYALLSEFINTTLPFEKMMAKDAIGCGDASIDVKLTDASYIEEESAYLRAEIDIYGSEYISIYPLIREGKYKLVACFPTNYKEQIIPVLENNQTAFIDHFHNSKKKINKCLSILTKRESNYPLAQMGEFLGGFVKGAISN